MLRQLIEIYKYRDEFFFQAISAVAILIACVVGLILGIVVNEYRKTSSIVTGLVNFIYTIPFISLLGFLIPLSGIGNTTAVKNLDF